MDQSLRGLFIAKLDSKDSNSGKLTLARLFIGVLVEKEIDI